MADRPVRYVIEGDASKLKAEFKDLSEKAKSLAASIKKINSALAGETTGGGGGGGGGRGKRSAEDKAALRAQKSEIDRLIRSLKLSEKLRKQNEDALTKRERDLRRLNKVEIDAAEKRKQEDEAWAKRGEQIRKERLRALREEAKIERDFAKLRKQRERISSGSRGISDPSVVGGVAPPKPVGRKTLRQLEAAREKAIKQEEARAYRERESQLEDSLKKQADIERGWGEYRERQERERRERYRKAWKQEDQRDKSVGAGMAADLRRMESGNVAGIRATQGLRSAEFLSEELARSESDAYEKRMRTFRRQAGREYKKIKDAEKAASGLEQKIKQVGNASKKTDSILATMGRNAANTFGSTAKRIKDVVTALFIFDTLRLVRDSIRNTFTFIIDATKQIEDARVGIASTITVAGRFVDRFGQALPIAEQIAFSLREADRIIPKLLQVSAQRGLSFDALLQTQTATAGFTKAAGFTPEQTVETIAAVAFFSEKLGISQGRIVRTLDNIIKGYRVSQTELGTSLGLNDKIIQQWREQGVLAEKLLELLAGTAKASEQNLSTLTGTKNALNAQLTILANAAGSDFFESVKESYKIILDGIKRISATPEMMTNLSSGLALVGQFFERSADSFVRAAQGFAESDVAGKIDSLITRMSGNFAAGTIGAIIGSLFGHPVLGAIGGVAIEESGVKISKIAGSWIELMDLWANGPGASPRNSERDAFVRDIMSSPALRRNASVNDLASLFGDATMAPGRGISTPVGIGTVLEDPRFVASALSGEPDTPSANRKGGRAARGRTPSYTSFINETRRGFTDANRLIEAAQVGELETLSLTKQRTLVAESELALLEARDAPFSAQLEKQREINRSKLAEVQSSKTLLEIEKAQLEIAFRRQQSLSPAEAAETAARIADVNRQINETEAQRIALINEQTAAIERQVNSQRKSADMLGGLIKGLRDGNNIGSLLETVGRDASDRFIDSFLKEKVGVLDPAIEDNFLTVIPDALSVAGKEGISGLGKIFSGAAGGASAGKEVVGSAMMPDGSQGVMFSDGTVGKAPGMMAGVGSMLGSVASGASLGAGLGSMAGLFGASAKEKKIATMGGAAAGALGGGIGGALTLGAGFGMAAGPVGAVIGSILGVSVGLILESLGVFKGPSSDRVIRRRIGDLFKESGLPKLGRQGGTPLTGIAGSAATARFLSLDETGQETKLGRGAFNVGRAERDLLTQLGLSTVGLSRRDQEAAAARVLGSASGGLDKGLERLTVRRSERLSNIEKRAQRAREAFGRAQRDGFANRGAGIGLALGPVGGLIGGLIGMRRRVPTSIKIGNETIDIRSMDAIAAYQAQAVAAANERFKKEIADFIDGIDEIPKAVDGASLAMSMLSADGTANMERLKDSIEDTAAVLETGFTGAIKELAQGSSLRSAVDILDKAYQDILTDRVSKRFLETQELNPNFTRAVDFGNQAIEAAMMGDYAKAQQLINQSNQFRNAANISGAQSLANINPVLRGINMSTTSGGINMPLYSTPTVASIPGPQGAPFPAIMHGGEVVRAPMQEDRILQQNNQMMGVLEDIAAILRSGRSVSVNAQPNVEVRVSSREISDAERNARKRQSSGDRKPNASIGVRV